MRICSHRASAAHRVYAAACAVAMAAQACMGAAPESAASILNAAGPILTVQMLNAATTLPAANMAVTVHTDNGIECARAPCPRNDREWKGMVE